VAERLVVRNSALTSGSDLPVLQSLATGTDGSTWASPVRAITRTCGRGYHDYAFQPLYPALVVLLSAPWPQSADLVAAIISNVAFAVAMVLLYHLGRPMLARAEPPLQPSSWRSSLQPSLPWLTQSPSALSVGAFLAAERDIAGPGYPFAWLH
jgi:hypothetical protein